MEEPPFLLDAARVLEFAILDLAGNRFGGVVEGVAVDQDSVSRLVIAESLVDGAVFLMHCTDRWETMAAGQYPDARAAESAAAAAYPEICMTWTKFRDLSAAEAREMETTRSFLRELAAENPDE